MAFHWDGNKIAADAAVDLSESQYLAVVMNSDGNLEIAGAGDAILGVLQDDPPLGDYGTVMHSDVTKWVAGGAITPGAEVAADANGKCVAATTGARIAGIALTAAGAEDEIVSVLLKSSGEVGA